MAIQSGGRLVLAETSPIFATGQFFNPSGTNLVGRFASYAAIYKSQLWVYTLATKIAYASARLPLKVYERGDSGRTEVRDSPYAQLLRKPNPKHDPFFFWLWTTTTLNVFGEALWTKVRDARGNVRELWPLHPVNVGTRTDGDQLTYLFFRGAVAGSPVYEIPEADVVHFKYYNPESTIRGLSPIEPLRQTLANEDAARRATSAFWANGARPAVALSHPGKLSDEAAKRLRASWDSLHAGADKVGSTAVLEEGMEPKVLSLSAEEAQYIESRKLNREECCAAYDMPPPVVHILDHATFSNIVEQMRSLYRDTMAPKLGMLESTLDMQLRPDFHEDDHYAEFLMDEVLRGAFEQRAESYQKAINSGWMKPSEVRAAENLEFVDGSDRLYINSTIIPIDEVSSRTSPNPPAEDVVPGEQPNPAQAEPQPTTAPIPRGTAARSLTDAEMRTVMGRLGNVQSIADIDANKFVKGLNGSSELVLNELATARELGETIAELRQRLKSYAEKPDPMLVLAKSLADRPEPVVNVTPTITTPPVSVTSPDVHVNVEAAPVPDVQVPVTVNVPEPRRVVKTVERDESGEIIRIIEEEQ